MSKAVLISIRPEWCAKIANREKTIEIRKTRPKLEPPFKCYIYCTKPSRSKMWRAGEHMCFNDDELYRDAKGKIKYGCSIELMACDDYSADNFLNGKVIGEFVCDEIDRYARYGWLKEPARYMKSSPGGYPATEIHFADLKISPSELEEYGKGAPLFGWHISELVIYDKPKKLSEFGVNRAPQLWRFINDSDKRI